MNSLSRFVNNSRFIIRKPRLMLRLFKNYFRLLILHKKVLRTLDIGISYRCQCKCEHCSASKITGEKILSLEKIKNAIDEALDMGAVQINLTGGEPLMSKHIFDIIEYIDSSKCITSINTNGIDLDVNKIKMLKKAGLDIVMISLDSTESSKHDKFRGYSGCHKAVVRAINNVVYNRMKLIVCTVATKENIVSGEIFRIYELVKKLGGTLLVNIPVAIGEWSNRYDILLDKNYMKKLQVLLKKKRVRRDIDGNYLKRGCGAGTENVYLTMYGDVLPCDFMQISFGNIHNSRLRDIWKYIHTYELFSRVNDKCLPGEDMEFIRNVMKHINSKNNLPIRVEDHPFFRR